MSAGRSAFRQVWIDGTEQQCDHPPEREEDVYNNAGVAIATVCKDCGVRIHERGLCQGCEKPDAWLTKFTGEKTVRGFCDGVCETAYKERKNLERKAR